MSGQSLIKKNNNNKMNPCNTLQQSQQAMRFTKGTIGLEPMTSRCAVECSTTELCPQYKGTQWIDYLIYHFQISASWP